VRLQTRPLLLRTHQRHDRGKAVRQRGSSQGKGSTMRHQANDAVGRYGVQLSQTDRGAQGVAGGCSHGAARNAFAASRGRKMYPLRLMKCQASHARPVGHMPIMRRRRQIGATARSALSLSMGGQCRGVGWGQKKVRCTCCTYIVLCEREVCLSGVRSCVAALCVVLCFCSRCFGSGSRVLCPVRG
jgi:hypothetical protein